MSDNIIKWFYKDTDFKQYKGYPLLSINGIILEINNTEKLRVEFGYIENRTTKIARARAEEMYDVESDVILAYVLSKCKDSERGQAEELINRVEDIDFSNDLILFGRAFHQEI